MSPGMTERETELLDLLREETARHCRFQANTHTMLAAIIRSNGGTLRLTRSDLAGGRPDEYILKANDLETGDVATGWLVYVRRDLEQAMSYES